jgi:HEPN domain-containing protein
VIKRFAAHELLKLGLLNDAVSRAYYAALHVARAVLVSEGVEPRSHAGISSMLGLHFVVPGLLAAEHGKELSRLEQFRVKPTTIDSLCSAPMGRPKRLQWPSASVRRGARYWRLVAGSTGEGRLSHPDGEIGRLLAVRSG